MTVRQVAEKLQEEKLVRSADFFYYYARYKQSGVKAGTYRISPSMNMAEILALLQSGRQEYEVVGIPEGYTIRKIAVLLEERGICPAFDFIAAASDPDLLGEYGIPAKTAQGFLFPDTYFLTNGIDAKEIVRMMIHTFAERVEDIPEFAGADAEELFRLVTLASIVEREYRRAEEAPLIASVFSNRLRYKIGLYSCATVEYIITEISGLPHPEVITYDDLKIDNPYNTYRYAGLPPGPISNPGLVALKAVAAPPKTSHYYFRLVNAATGEHYFSSDFEEHIDAGITFYTKGR
jgi:UPF0755 protein